MSEKKKAIVFGNGKSRLALSPYIDILRKDYFLIGCNAIHRDFVVDALIATDIFAIASVVQSGYSQKYPCYFRDWKPFPADCKETFLAFVTDSTQIVDLHKDEPNIVASGHNPITDDLVTGDAEFCLLGVPANDLAKDVTEIGLDGFAGFRFEFCGPNALHAAVNLGYKEIYLIGFDFASNADGTVNNVYTGTENYMQVGAKENTKMEQSKDELAYVMKRTDARIAYVSPNLPFPTQFEKLNNVIEMTLDTFMKGIKPTI